MSKKLLIVLAVAILGVGTAACNRTDSANANSNLAVAEETRVGPDNSEITTSTDASGTKTETRVFRNNPRVSKVVVTTTRDGRRTVRVYSATSEEKVVDNIGDALTETGDALAKSAGFVADKSEDALDETADKLEDVGDKTASGAKKVGEKTVQGAKTVGKKTEKAIKKVIP